jgi:hypothetical protein
MIKRPILTIMLAALTFVATMTASVMNDDNMKASILDDVVNLFESDAEPLKGSIFTPLLRLDPGDLTFETMDLILDDHVVLGKYGEWTYCQYEAPEEVEYGVEFVSATVDEEIEGGGVFLVDFELKNTGNVRLFGEDAGCEDFYPLNLGTQNEMDRASQFGKNNADISGWLSSNRVKIVEDYVDPGETFHAKFQSVAPVGDDVHREWFQPVVEWTAWVGEPFYVDIVVDSPTETMLDNISFAHSVSISASELEGLERSLEIDLSDQMMFAKMGETTVWSFMISSGAYDTPTPRGNYQVLNKQELRIGGASPHYRMPYWQGWRVDGYGLHALPYLANDNGAFWSEALDHIGIPVSHGCIRQLPDDAQRLYEFTDIGTPLYVHD